MALHPALEAGLIASTLPETLKPSTVALYRVGRVVEHFLRLNPFRASVERSIAAQVGDLPEATQRPIDTVTSITVEAFRETYVKTCTPVILKGFAKSWPCGQRWSPEYFIEAYGDRTLAVMNNVMEEREFNVEDLTMKHLMESIQRGETTKYLRFCSLKYTAPELLDDFDLPTVAAMMGKSERIARNNGQVFAGAAGTHTMLHAAPPHNFFVQAYGVKNWRIYGAGAEPIIRPGMDRSPFYASHFTHKAPDLQAYPGMDKVHYYDFDLEPGDVLYNPPSYWHLVTNKTATIAVGFRWMDARCFQVNFEQMLLLLFATNPTLLFSIRNKKNYANHFKYLQDRQNRQNLSS